MKIHPALIFIGSPKGRTRFRIQAIPALLVLLTALPLFWGGCLTPVTATDPPVPIPEVDFGDLPKPVVLNLKNPVDEFRILQLTDTQFLTGEDAEVLPLFNQVQRLIRRTQPHLIVLTGDNTEGPNALPALKRLIPFLDSFQIPYAAVFGNHDPELLAKEALIPYYTSGKYSLFQPGPSQIHGVGNYQIQLKVQDAIKYSFILIDSNVDRTYTDEEKANSYWGGTSYDYIYPDQIAWYREVITRTNAEAGFTVPSLAFFHIALPEFRSYRNFRHRAETEVVIPQSFGGETVCNPVVNTGLFQQMKALGSTQGCFVGHDHVNNYVIRYQGILLGYGLKTGRNS